MENKISVTISPEVVVTVNKAIETINNSLPFLINLTNDDRKALLKMGDKSMAFVNKGLEYAKQNQGILPVYLNIPEFEKDVVVTNDLASIRNSLLQLIEKLDDTVLQAGSEAFNAALIFYTAVKGAAKAGQPGMKTIYADLQSRFPGRSKAAAQVNANIH